MCELRLNKDGVFSDEPPEFGCSFPGCPRYGAAKITIVNEPQREDSYLSRSFNWARFNERVLSSLINASIYGGGIVLLRAIGLL